MELQYRLKILEAVIQDAFHTKNAIEAPEVYIKPSPKTNTLHISLHLAIESGDRPIGYNANHPVPLAPFKACHPEYLIQYATNITHSLSVTLAPDE